MVEVERDSRMKSPKDKYNEKLELEQSLREKETEVILMQKDIKIAALEYRLESVKRVLDFLNDECRTKREVDYHTYLVHCINKINGNLDGLELKLESGKG